MQSFLGFKGTALSAPLSFMLIQLFLTWLAIWTIWHVRNRRAGLYRFILHAGAGWETNLNATIQPGGFNILQSIILLVNLFSAVAMLVLGGKALLVKRASHLVRA